MGEIVCGCVWSSVKEEEGYLSNLLTSFASLMQKYRPFSAYRFSSGLTGALVRIREELSSSAGNNATSSSQSQ